MHVLVRVEMCHPDAFTSNSVDLRRQLSFDLLERHSPSQAGDDERLPRRAEPSIVFDQGGHAGGREHRCTVDECKMDSDAEGGTNADTMQRVNRRRRIGEQAGAGEDASVMGVEDAGVDAHGQAKVIGVDDKLSKHGYLPEMRNT